MSFSPMVVNLLAFKINIMDRAAQMSIGPSHQVDLFVSTKINQGFGEETGDVVQIFFPLSIILDQDVNDSNSAKGSVV
nr:hypothetical protein [Paenibacillus abyssi]